MSARLDDLLAKLKGVKDTKNGWKALCPAHDDHDPSLAINKGDDGGILIKCRVGCDSEAVVGAIGWRMADLMPPRIAPVTPARSREVARYQYRDESGKVLKIKVRTVDQSGKKGFYWTRPNGERGVQGVPDVVYRLPELVGQSEIFIAEGEKDCDNVARLGLIAACNSNGAPNWGDAHADQLARHGVKRVFILPDNDAIGREHAQLVARACTERGIEARIVELPGLREKGDVSDWIEAGGTAADLITLAERAPVWTPEAAASAAPAALLVDDTDEGRRLRLVPASAIAIRRVEWLWKERIALGALGLLGGREGIGKSILGYTLAASVTQGKLEGAFFGTKRAVVIVATEDSKEHTIVPRLMAAGADLDLVYFVTVADDGVEADLVLPVDVLDLTRVVREVGAALVLLDPLLSRLEASLDSHKDAEARRALEPLARLADETNASILGLIHVNKSSSNDPLTMLMASRAFAAVARFVLFAMVDPEDEQKRLLGLAKSNLGRTDLPTQSYRIVPHCVAQTDEGGVWTGKLEWLGEHAGTIREAIHNTAASGDKSATAEAADWLADYLTAAGGSADSAEIKRAGAKAGHTADHLRRARERLRLKAVSVGFPRTTKWVMEPKAA